MNQPECMYLNNMRNLNQPLITIVMSAFNAGDFLTDALDSILGQTYKNWELILIDDGSSDGSINIVRNIKKYNDKRIKFYSDGENLGLAARLNQAIVLSQGDYIARMDADDISVLTRLEEQVNFLLNNPTIDLLATRVETINLSGRHVGTLPYALTHDEITSKPWRSIYMPHPTWMGKASWFKKYKYAEPAPYFCEDQELLLRSFKTSKFACLNKVLLSYRIRDNINISKLWSTYFAVYKLQFKYFSRSDFFYSILATATFLLRNIKMLHTFIKQKVQ